MSLYMFSFSDPIDRRTFYEVFWSTLNRLHQALNLLYEALD